MTQQPPITPTPELVEQWCEQLFGCPDKPEIAAYELVRLGAQWGADQELEACCQALYDRYDSVRRATGFPGSDMSDWLRSVRRPKPPSLKEQALEALRHAPGPDYPNPITLLTADEHALIRRALEQLDD